MSTGIFFPLLKTCKLVLNQKLVWTVLFCLNFFIVMLGTVKGKIYHFLFFFLLYINDLERYLIVKGVQRLKELFQYIGDDLFIFMKLFLFFYADDTVILSKTQSGLQHWTNFFVYCETWRLHVNVKKPKIVITCVYLNS